MINVNCIFIGNKNKYHPDHKGKQSVYELAQHRKGTREPSKIYLRKIIWTEAHQSSVNRQWGLGDANKSRNILGPISWSVNYVETVNIHCHHTTKLIITLEFSCKVKAVTEKANNLLAAKLIFNEILYFIHKWWITTSLK